MPELRLVTEQSMILDRPSVLPEYIPSCHTLLRNAVWDTVRDTVGL